MKRLQLLSIITTLHMFQLAFIESCQKTVKLSNPICAPRCNSGALRCKVKENDKSTLFPKMEGWIPFLSGLLCLSLVSLCDGAPASVILGNLFPDRPNLGYPTGQELRPGFELAVEEINNSTELLPDTTIVPIYGNVTNSACDLTQGISNFIEQAEQGSIAIVGPACSSVCVPVAMLAKNKEIPIVSYSCATPELSDAHRFPFFTRTISPDLIKSVVFFELCKLFNWMHVGVLATSTNPLHYDSAVYFIELCDTASIKHTLSTFTQDSPYEIHLSLLTQFKASHYNVFVAFSYAGDVRNMIRAAMELGIIGKGYAWMHAGGGFSGQWWNSTGQFTPEVDQEVLMSAEGSLYAVHARTISSDYFVNTYGPRYLELYNGGAYKHSLFLMSVLVYDAVYLVAHALHSMIVEGANIDGVTLNKYMRRKFDGLGSHRPNDTMVNDAKDDMSIHCQRDGVLVETKQFSSLTNVISDLNPPVDWYFSANNSVPPIDRIIADTEVKWISNSTSIVIYCMASVCVVLTLVILFKLFQHRDYPIIMLLYGTYFPITVVGAFFLFTAVYLLGVFPTDAICKARVILGHVGFAAMFGSLLVKTHGVVSVFTNNSIDKVAISVRSIFSKILLLISVALLLVMFYLVFEPPKHIVVPNKNNELLHHVQCTESKVWKFVLMAFEAAVLLWGAYLAVRGARLPDSVNESKRIAVSVYNILLFSLVFVPIVTLADMTPDMQMIFEAFAISFCTLFSVVILTLPRLMDIKVASLTQVTNLTNATWTETGCKSFDCMHCTESVIERIRHDPALWTAIKHTFAEELKNDKVPDEQRKNGFYE